MTFTAHIADAYRRSFQIKGRSSRSEFWCFQGFLLLVWGVLLIGQALRKHVGYHSPVQDVIYLSYMLCSLVLILSIPARVTLLLRRVRDAGGDVLWPIAFCLSFLAGIGLTVILVIELGHEKGGGAGPFLISSEVFKVLSGAVLTSATVSSIGTFVYTLKRSR